MVHLRHTHFSYEACKHLQICIQLLCSCVPKPPASVATMHFTADTVIVITGSCRGLGLEFVKHFLEYTDSKVVATARSLSKADILRTLITQYAKRLQTVALDTSEESSIEASVKEISALHSGIDLLINNAGIEEGVGPIWETTGAT